MSDRTIPNPDMIGRIDTTFTQLDQQRTQGLERLQQIQAVQNTALVREQQRLTAKYGAEHPRVQKINARLIYNQGLERELSQEIERSKIDVPQHDRNTWQGHGFVLDNNRVGIQGLTISFVDEQNNWIRALGYACTNQQGYFSILYPPRTGQPSSSPDFPPIFLTVTDANQRVLHRERTSRVVKLGAIEFWRIILGDENGGTCDPPDPDKPPRQAVQVQRLDVPTQLAVDQPGNFSARINDDATPPVTSRWDFGDGATATGLTATHAYAKAGNYTVSFTATNPVGSDARTAPVTVNPTGKGVQVLKMDVPSSLAINQPGNFSARINEDATPPVTSRWDFGDGATATGLTATHAYAKAGNYTVSFTATNPVGSDARTGRVSVRKEFPKVYRGLLWIPPTLILIPLYYFLRA
jgi:chitodextrinase